MSDREHKKSVARTESAFRDVNERVMVRAATDGVIAPESLAHVPIVCECARVDCNETLAVAADVYERVRQDGTLFFVTPGHVIVDVEHVVEQIDHAWVVRKVGTAGEESERLDKRS